MSSNKLAASITADEDDDYNSSDDEDFNPDQQPGHADDDGEDSSSDSEEEDTKPTRKSSKRKIKDEPSATSDLVEGNSGDEAIIRGAKAKRKKVKNEGGYDEGDEGGEGGLIKTRAQRAKEAKERAPLSTTKAATVDVDELWKSLNATAPPAAPPSGVQSTVQTITTSRIEPVSSSQKSDDHGIQVSTAEAATAVPLPAPLGSVIPPEGVESRTETTAIIPVEKNGMITIKRTYEFAGETVVEEKVVPANSFEARAYLSSLQTVAGPPAPVANQAKPLRRPMRKASKFDPGAAAGPAKKATKLNSLEKSRLDWAGFVDKEGIGEELDRQRREGGDSYLERQDFLGRVGHRTNERK
ncbi:swr complex subunit [Orbilia ellipsospora]|uniref:SWR1-complex protein 5 n=1 Tax=Orbilia ellipsospora TaxID=2528407 RepID=A0AAV9XE78_9PEZI